MPEYVDTAAVKKRATVNGWSWIADRDRDGQTNTTETGEIDAAIERAGYVVDHIAQYKGMTPAQLRSAANSSLKYICLAIATWELWTNGGDDPPESVIRAYDEALAQIARYKSGEDIPGLIRQYPLESTKSSKVPRAYMPR